MHKSNSFDAFQRPFLQQTQPCGWKSCYYHPAICYTVGSHPLLLIAVTNSVRRVLFAWQNPGVPVDEVMADIMRCFHHPALRDESIEIQRNMFATVRTWVDEQPDRHNLDSVLSSESVKAGRNHTIPGGGNRDINDHDHDHGALGGHGKTRGSIWDEIKTRDLQSMEGSDGNPNAAFMSASPQPGTPNHPPHSPNFGYQNIRPGSSNYERPHSQGGHLDPSMSQGGYQGSYQQQQPYGMPPGPPPGNFGAPYPNQQPPYGGPGPYGQPPPGPWQQGPPPLQFGGPPPPNPYGQYPPQPNYGGYQQYPPRGGYGGGY